MVAATGLGKTVMMAGLAESWPLGRVMMISHRFELNKQARDKFEEVCGETPDFEQAHFEADRCTIANRSRMVVASVQSLNAKRNGKYRFEKFDPNEFGLLMIDEAHRATSATYRRVIEYFQSNNPDCCLVGVTATPDRLDGVGLGHVFETVACDLNIRWGIDNGWLVPLKQQFVTVEGLDFSTIKSKKNEAGESDLDRTELSKLLEKEAFLHEMAHPIVELAGDKQAIIFTTSVSQADRLAEIINRHKTGSAIAIDGSLPPTHPKRVELIDRFKQGEIQFFCNCGIATEGFDAPNVELVAIARPTKSRALYCFDNQTEVLTKRGWVLGESVAIGDEVLAFCMEDGTAQFEAVRDHIKRRLLPSEFMVELSNPSTSIRCTNTHSLVVSTRTGRKNSWSEWKRVLAHEVLQFSGTKFRIPCSGTSEIEDVAISDDDIRFIGLVQTDGHVNPLNSQIMISQQYPQIRQYIERVLNGCGFKWRCSEDNKATRFGERRYPLCVYRLSKGKPRGEDKHLTGWGRLYDWIPKANGDKWDRLEQLSERQFGVLLEAWHQGDGSKQIGQEWTRRSYHLAVGKKSRHVADWLQAESIKRGWACHISDSDTVWMVHLKKISQRSINPKHVVKSGFSKNELVWCVSVDSGALFVRRNGKVCVAGNTQMVGRGTRPVAEAIDGLAGPAERKAAIANSKKPFATVLDFLGQSGRHSLVCTGDILAGENDPPEIVEAAHRRVAKDFDGDMIAALEAAREDARRAEEARRAKLTAKARYSVSEVDIWSPMQWVPPRSVPGFEGATPPSEKMKGALRKFGFTNQEIGQMNFKQAKSAISKCITRIEGNLCSLKQKRLLSRYGIDANNMTMQQASQEIDRIASNGWRR